MAETANLVRIGPHLIDPNAVDDPLELVDAVREDLGLAGEGHQGRRLRVEVTSTRKKPESRSQGSDEASMQAAEQAKREGNELFRQGLEEDAKRRYRWALHLLRRTSNPAAVTARRLRAACYANLAQCDLDTRDYASCMGHASKTLKLDPNNVKALFRRAEAHRGRGERQLAARDLERAIALAPDDEVLRRALAQLGEEAAADLERERRLARRFFQQQQG